MYRWETPKNNKPIWVIWIVTGVLLFSGLGSLLVMTTQPTRKRNSPTTRQLDPNRLEKHVRMLSETFAPRNYKRHWNLEKTANYISTHFAQAGGELSEQAYEVDGRNYRNVIVAFGPETGSRIVVGAHYDTYEDTPGADDNASGTAGLIELAYLLGKTELKQRVELVAFTLEEPPFFRTGNMGSARHAYKMNQENAAVEAMICLEMIGCFSDEKNSQRFPSPILKLLYPDTGNFIAIIGRMADRKLAKQIKISMRSATDLPVHCMCAPEGYPGIDYSDHRNYWARGYNAVMITDTAFMRNHRYHQHSDTADTLNYDSMSKTVLAVYEAVIQLADN